MCDLSLACLWPGLRLYLDSLGDGFWTLLCPGYGMFMWPVMAVWVDCFVGCFVGISYATIDLKNQVIFACF